MAKGKRGGWLGWVLGAAALGGLWWLARPGEEGRVFAGLDYEQENEEVCAAGPGRLIFSGEPSLDGVGTLIGIMSKNADRAQATLSPWRSVTLFDNILAHEADWTREGQQYAVRVVGPTPLDDDATICLFGLD
ncbi:hypothetical protein [Deinococcus aquaedulcis]|uniref:hypothetical protein n=1 Tax=Deinococcus aquaedulcis TaxID=2840455 RepID=UPI001C83580B|nr:hypothetical protein [Deinococcus aquaedulcis]